MFLVSLYVVCSWQVMPVILLMLLLMTVLMMFDVVVSFVLWL